jgi:ribonuclease BN (tRNA processing enzyme)
MNPSCLVVWRTLAVTFEVVVLGSEPAWPSGPRACSGYLVRTAESTVLIDCGTGVFGRLVDVLAPEGLTGVVISHLHFDHWADLVPFRYYLSFEARPDVSPRLYLPPGAIEKLQTITEAIDPAPGFLTDVFETAGLRARREAACWRLEDHVPANSPSGGDLRP